MLHVYVRKRGEAEGTSEGLIQERKWIINRGRVESSGGKATEIDVEFPNDDPKWRRYVEEREVQRLGASGMLGLTVGGGLSQPSSLDTHRSHESQSITARSSSREFESEHREAENSEI